MQAVYTVLREAEYRSTYPLPYWNVPLLRWLVPRQRRCQEALRLINATLDSLIAESKRLVRPAHCCTVCAALRKYVKLGPDATPPCYACSLMSGKLMGS